MADLRWEKMRYCFDPELMGALPDLHVPSTSTADWQAVLDLVREREWTHEYTEGRSVLSVPSAQTVLSRPADAECAQLRVWLTPVMVAIFRFYAEDRIDFDIDLRVFRGQADLDVFCEFLTVLGQRLGKPVLMDAEGGDGKHSVLGYSPTHDRVVCFVEPVRR
ncbi:hypothetical protein LO763_22475 [Glycomyces sp. A-F 0318]|uniref:hypothetical protein n=1 Tax=Glycomyces amatae TaxID=2881355 RepID=UPI001E2D1D5D|nr:hypothetical protein [Glycomyces amatae]MCD0446385.1 hypothetical protein [Glycomyces amatae]